MSMYHLTASERATIDDAVGYLFDRLDSIHEQLMVFWEDNFGVLDDAPICKEAKKVIGDGLVLLCDALFEVNREYALATGRKDYSGVEAFLETAQEAREAIECDELLEAAYQEAAKLPKEEREKKQARLDNISDLPDKQAIEKLKAILKEATE